MNKDNHKVDYRKKAIRLAILWGIVYIMLGMADLFLNARAMIYSGSPFQLKPGSWLHIAVVLAYLLILCPLAYYIQRVAKQADMKWLMIFARFALAIMLIAVSASVITAFF